MSSGIDNNEISCNALAQDAHFDPTALDLDPSVTDFGEYTLPNLQDHIDLILADCQQTEDTIRHTMSFAQPNLELLCPLFGWALVDRIKKTIASTTQFAIGGHLPLWKHFKSRFPACNLPRYNESLTTDSFFCNTPADVDGILGYAGATLAQLFSGKTSSKTVVYPLHADLIYPKLLKISFANIVLHPTVSSLIISRPSVVNRFLIFFVSMESRTFRVSLIISIKTLPDVRFGIPNASLTPSWTVHYGDQCLFLAPLPPPCVFHFNCLASDSLGGLTLLQIATGQRPDISALLQFHWFEPVLYSVDHSFPSDSPEKSDHWVGVAETQGGALAYPLSLWMILTRSLPALQFILPVIPPIQIYELIPVPVQTGLEMFPVPVKVLGSIRSL
jgi:hypothetical protein